ncbi:MAG TPA: uracil-DNA glycosylase [Symbiobacteriaceae bacterium]|nr:uracil-DNA glycosylase [Symbiobacteriaceae bacterium]
MEKLFALQNEIARCERCPRLRQYCAEVAATRVKRFQHQEYWGRPVPGFGDPAARLYILGLAPAAHGGNRTGRMFTGDDSGNWLYGALHRFGFANRAESVWRDDGLELTGAYIGAAGRCAPPDNKPSPAELQACQPYVEGELGLLSQVKVVLVLGRIAFERYIKILKSRGVEVGKPVFAHGAEYLLGGRTLLCSYHPSRQNTNTGVLTREMWDAIFARARFLADN